MKLDHISRPTLIVDKNRLKKNIRKIMELSSSSNAELRPHMKTCQSATVGEILREFGITKISVSNLDQAEYFYENGWKDILLAFPVNVREKDRINRLQRKINLGLLIDSKKKLELLSRVTIEPTNLWIEIDTGYSRTGVKWDDWEQMESIILALKSNPLFHCEGILTHSGNTYSASNKEQILRIHELTVERLSRIKSRFGPGLKLSLGNTPSCSLSSNYEDISEIRAGNFMYYDLVQTSLGSCSIDEIAVVAALPIVSVRPKQNKVVIHGGAVHLSKDSMTLDGKTIYGIPVKLLPDRWEPFVNKGFVSALSQEHGTIMFEEGIPEGIQEGDLIGVLPVHSCLTADLLKNTISLTGEKVDVIGRPWKINPSMYT